MASLLALGACNTTYLEQRTDQPQNAADIVRATDLQPRFPKPTGTVDTGGTAAQVLFRSSARPAPPPALNAPALRLRRRSRPEEGATRSISRILL